MIPQKEGGPKQCSRPIPEFSQFYEPRVCMSCLRSAKYLMIRVDSLKVTDSFRLQEYGTDYTVRKEDSLYLYYSATVNAKGYSKISRNSTQFVLFLNKFHR